MASKKTSANDNSPAGELYAGIIAADPAALARAITLVESTNDQDRENALSLIDMCLPVQRSTVRVGITGIPGVGKSTFIEALGATVTALGIKVAVLAIDPTSSRSKGSIMGDKTRMPGLANNPLAFIRPSPAGENLGGVARSTREAMVLCEAAGYDLLLIETVGVGQSETAVHSMVDFFLLLQLAGAGDELQGIKRGIIEMADIIVINKDDGENKKNVQQARSHLERALELYPPRESGWKPRVLSCSSSENKGIAEIWALIQEYIRTSRENGLFKANRQQQNEYWFKSAVSDQLHRQFYNNSEVRKKLALLTAQVNNGEISPFRAANLLLQSYHD